MSYATKKRYNNIINKLLQLSAIVPCGASLQASLKEGRALSIDVIDAIEE